MSEVFDYAALTRNDPHPFKRYLQARRLQDALDLLGDRHGAHFVDYGAGDGELIRQLKRRRPDAVSICFEPSPVLFYPCLNNIEGLTSTGLVGKAEDVPDGFADVVFCLEVFEHLPPKEMETAIEHMWRMLQPEGLLIVGVPVEIGPVAWLKGAFRRRRRRMDFDADWGRIAQAARGDIRFERHLQPISEGLDYYPHHLGFDYRDLLRRLQTRFVIETRRSSPLAVLPPEWNSELNLLLRKR